MSQLQPDWYNRDRVAVPGSVVLAKWNQQRQLARDAAAKQADLQRAYAGAANGRLNNYWSALNTSADSEIVTSLRPLRSRARQLVRDNEYAKNAVRIIQNNVIGGGVGMQAQASTASGKLIDNINGRIEESWESWCDKGSCHVAGLLGFSDLERTITGMLATDGEVLIRKIKQPFGESNTPFALEIIEADRLVDQWSTAFAPNGNMIRMGVEIDQWMRPVAYWMYPTHPGDMQFASVFVASRFIRVPADEIIHLYIIDRWPQTRGVSWFHTCISGLGDIGGYEEAEIVKARAQASVVGFIKAPEPLGADGIQDKQRVRNFEPGTIEQLLPGEDFVGFNPSSPNPGMDPFLRYMLRRTAAGIGLSYESLSRDYSQSNYSSSRLALLDDRDLWRVLQGFVIRNFRLPIHRAWMAAAVMGGDLAIPDFYTNKAKYQKVRFKPRGWSWIDPAKEVAAYKMAVRCGFMTVGDVIDRTADGADLEDILKARKKELEMMEEMEMVLDTDPAQVNDKGIAQPNLAPEADAVAGAGDEPEAGTESTAEDNAEPAEDTSAADANGARIDALIDILAKRADPVVHISSPITVSPPSVHITAHVDANREVTKTVISERLADGTIISKVSEK